MVLNAEFISTQLAILRSVSASHNAEKATLLREQRDGLLEEKQVIESTLAALRKAKEERSENGAPLSSGNAEDLAKKIAELNEQVQRLEKQKAAASAAFQASQDDVEALLRRASALEADAAAAVVLRQEVHLDFMHCTFTDVSFSSKTNSSVLRMQRLSWRR